MTQESTTRLEPLRRYGLVALAFLHIGVGRGLHGTFGVFFVAMLDAFGWSRATTAGAISLAIIFEGACLPWVGGLIDRFGGRKTLMFGGLVLFIGLGFASTISSIWQFYFWIGIVSAAGIALIGMVPHVAIITREFPERRGTGGRRSRHRSIGAGGAIDGRQMGLVDGVRRPGGDYSPISHSAGAVISSRVTLQNSRRGEPGGG
jgi:MFS family permease